MSKFVKKKSENFDEIKYLKSIRLKPKLVKSIQSIYRERNNYA